MDANNEGAANAPNKVQIMLGLPKGRMQDQAVRLLGDAGLPVVIDEREYRPKVGNGAGAYTKSAATIEYSTKLLKPQNIVEMLASGSRDVGFAGADWVCELGADLVELLDTGMDPVRLVVAAPESVVREVKSRGGGPAAWEAVCGRTPVLASEYENIAQGWIRANILGTKFIRSYGATEAFPPEDADLIIDNCATGNTLKANGLVIMDTIMTSSTRLYASKAAMADKAKKEAADSLVLLLKAVLEARRRVMLEVNVNAELLEELVAILPCLKSPTISPLDKGKAYAVRVAAPKESLAELIPEIKRCGGTDIVVTALSQLVP